MLFWRHVGFSSFIQRQGAPIVSTKKINDTAEQSLLQQVKFKCKHENMLLLKENESKEHFKKQLWKCGIFVLT